MAQPSGIYMGDLVRRYDRISRFNKGNREHHWAVLRNLMNYGGFQVSTFCDLGCGTGEMTNVILEAAPGARGMVVDGSAEMLSLAMEKLHSHFLSIEPIESTFQMLDWSRFRGQFDLVASCLAIHHLTDPEKWACFEGVFQSLVPNGRFVLFDLFRSDDERETTLLEYLACADVRDRMATPDDLASVARGLSIDDLITGDRAIRSAEGDQETTLSAQTAALRRVGFDPVTVVMQEARLFGLIAFRPGPCPRDFRHNVLLSPGRERTTHG